MSNFSILIGVGRRIAFFVTFSSEELLERRSLSSESFISDRADSVTRELDSDVSSMSSSVDFKEITRDRDYVS